VVAEISSTITRWLTSGWARQFLADEGEEPVLDFVPLAGAGGRADDATRPVRCQPFGVRVSQPDREPCFRHPQPCWAGLGGDSNRVAVGVTRPPTLATTVGSIHREGGRVMIDADTHPSEFAAGHRP